MKVSGPILELLARMLYYLLKVKTRLVDAKKETRTYLINRTAGPILIPISSLVQPIRTISEPE